MTKQIKLQQYLTIKAVDDGNNIITAVGSAEAVDRDGDIVKLDGLNLKNYKNNPVVFFNHASRELPVAKATDVRVDGKKLIFTLLFAGADQNPLAPFVYESIKAGFLNSLSIGFIPDYDKVEYKQDKKTNKRIRVYTASELLEVSIVGIPANPSAVVLRSYEQHLANSWEKGIIDGAELKSLQSMLDGVKTNNTDDKDAKIKELEDYIKFLETELEEKEVDNVMDDPYAILVAQLQRSDDDVYAELVNQYK